MRTADLCVRVSTDEQAEKGYSLRSQKDVLIRYCEQHNIKVREVYVEDHSAKTFNRPEWKKLMIIYAGMKVRQIYCSTPNGIGLAGMQPMLRDDSLSKEIRCRTSSGGTTVRHECSRK